MCPKKLFNAQKVDNPCWRPSCLSCFSTLIGVSVCLWVRSKKHQTSSSWPLACLSGVISQLERIGQPVRQTVPPLLHLGRGQTPLGPVVGAGQGPLAVVVLAGVHQVRVVVVGGGLKIESQINFSAFCAKVSTVTRKNECVRSTTMIECAVIIKLLWREGRGVYLHGFYWEVGGGEQLWFYLVKRALFSTPGVLFLGFADH